MKRVNIKIRDGKSRAVMLLWLFILLSFIFGGAALVSQHLAVHTFGWTSTVYRERREIVSELYLSINSADIPLEVYTYDGAEIIIEYTGADALVIERDEYGLKIGRDEDFKLSLFSRDKLNYKMQVWLPDVNYREIRLMSASGDISARNVRADSLIVTSRLGDISLFAPEGITDAVTLRGSVYVEFIDFNAPFFIETDSGDVRIIMSENESHGVKLDFLTYRGRFTSDFFRREYDGHQGDLYLSTGENPIQFTVNTITGNLDFHKRTENTE
ncbi:MAG: DUF4097 domain-containing protein [Oscillospiraceae bacterium]|nr:DUF4097 domain-containing protein [Oscillospiraceae bacterium]